jgi:hypothetical protein
LRFRISDPKIRHEKKISLTKPGRVPTRKIADLLDNFRPKHRENIAKMCIGKTLNGAPARASFEKMADKVEFRARDAFIEKRCFDLFLFM